jgi:hypothetical protein
MVIYIPTMSTKYIAPGEIASSSDFLHGCFVSCLIDSSKNAVMGHWGAGLSGTHLDWLKEVASENLTDIVKGAILFLREEDQMELVCSYGDYLGWLDGFKSSIQEEFGCNVKTVPYYIGAIINLELERNLSVD